jgi:uncharacterized protein YbjT (DUF2867 family)
MILVIGATGTTGTQVVKALTGAGEQVRALARTPEKAKALAGPGVEFVRGDLADPTSLEPAFRGADRVFLVSAPDPQVGRLHANATAAAKKAGVKHLVRLSALGSDPKSPVSLLRLHGEADAALATSGVPYTVLRPHYFMQNTLWFADAIRKDGAFHAPMRDGKISAIDARDIGEVAAAILRDAPRHAGRTYDLTGPAALGFQDFAAVFERVLGRPVKYVDVSPPAARAAMLGMGVPDWLADGLVALYGQFAAGRAATVAPATAELRGKAARTFEQFVRDHAAAFGRS